MADGSDQLPDFEPLPPWCWWAIGITVVAILGRVFGLIT